jgi:hypothetical protein
MANLIKEYRYEVNGKKLYVYTGRNLLGIYDIKRLEERRDEAQRAVDMWDERIELLKKGV